MTTQALQRTAQRSHPIAWGKIVTGAVGLILLVMGLGIMYFVSTSPDRRTSSIAVVVYEPVVDDIITGKRASTGLYWVPASLTVSDRISIEEPLMVELKAPLLTDVEQKNGGTEANPSTYLDGPAVQEFVQANPGRHDGITLDGSKTYSITVRPIDNDKTLIQSQGISSKPQELSPDREARWTWTMTGMQKGLDLEQTQFDVLVHDQDGNLAGRAIVTLKFNPIMPPEWIYLMMFFGGVLMVVGFSHLLDPFFEREITTYFSGQGMQTTPHHRYGRAFLSWALFQNQKQSAQNRQRSPFGQNSSDIISPFQTLSVGAAIAWLDRQAYLPTNKAFEKRLQFSIIKRSHERTRKFQELSALSDDVKQKLLLAVRRLSHQMVRIDISKERWMSFVWLLGCLLALLNINYIIEISDRAFPAQWLNAMMEVNILMAILAVLLSIYIGPIMVLLPIAVPVFLINLLWENRRRKHHPDAIIVDKLISILASTERSDVEWRSKDSKKDILANLEIIATNTEYFLPRRLRSRDANTDRWFQKSAAGVAAAIRELKLWVLTPKADTRTHFVSRIAALLEHFLRGEWDALPQAEAPSALRPTLSRIVSFIGNVLWALIVGLIPFVAVQLAFRNGFMKSDSQISEYILGGTALFAILSVLRALDPGLSDNLGFVKTIVEMILPWKKSQD